MAPSTVIEPETDAMPADVTVVDAFGERASDQTIESTAEALRAKGYAVHIVETGDDAKRVILDLLPEGGEVGQGASQTLETIGSRSC